jgi:hypothetical protein
MKFSPIGFSYALEIEQNPFGANSLLLFLTISFDTIPSELSVL